MKKTIILGKHVSPSAPPAVSDTGKLWKVKMSCGGGLGGTSWEEYGKFLDELKPATIVRFEDHFTGAVKLLNTNYIVTAQVRKYVSILSDLSRNTCYGKEYHFSIRTYLMDTDAEYSLVDKCNIEPEVGDAELINIQFIK